MSSARIFFRADEDSNEEMKTQGKLSNSSPLFKWINNIGKFKIWKNLYQNTHFFFFYQGRHSHYV